MDFEEMKVVWDAQEERSVFALDLEALHASVRRRARGIAFAVNAMELGMIAICLFVAGTLAAEPFLEGEDYNQYFGAALLLGIGVFVLIGRVRRRRRDRDYEESLAGDLERAISQLDYHLWRANNFHWWFLAPSVLIVGLNAVLNHQEKPLWTWPLTALAMAFAMYLIRLEIRCVQEPKKRDLEALRAKLRATD